MSHALILTYAIRGHESPGVVKVLGILGVMGECQEYLGPDGFGDFECLGDHDYPRVGGFCVPLGSLFFVFLFIWGFMGEIKWMSTQQNIINEMMCRYCGHSQCTWRPWLSCPSLTCPAR